MTLTAAGSPDRLFRSIAYDAICRRDRLSGWKRHRREFLQEQALGREDLARVTRLKLQRILTHAYESTSWYRQAWDSVGFKPSAPVDEEALIQLPFLTKDVIRAHKADLTSNRIAAADLDLSYTGGTTGTQTAFHLDHACTVARVGRQWGILQRCGYRPGMKRGLVWGVHADLMPETVAGGLKRRFRDYAYADEVLRCTLMNAELLAQYHQRLVRFSPDVLYGYPSALVELATFIQDRGLSPIRVETIMTTAERLSVAQRDIMESVFGGEVFNLYCTREYGCIGFECRKHRGLHIDSGSVFVEIIRDGRRVAPGESGEITITDLLNHGMPFIRSRTGDMGSLSAGPCECGSSLPVLASLDGRATDFIYRPDGSIVAGLMLTDLFLELPSIRFAQFIQEKPRELDVYIVVTPEYSQHVEDRAVEEIRELVGNEMIVRMKRVAELPRAERSGKFREVICTIDRPAPVRSPVACP